MSDQNNISVQLPDGSKRTYPVGASLYDVAFNISPNLAKSAVAGKINGTLFDLDTKVTDGCQVEITLDRSADGVGVIRHSTAHLMAMAIQSLFPGTQITIGPVVENQFYYDILPAEGVKFSSDHFAAIEQKMQEIAKKNIPVVRKVVSKSEAIQYFKSLGETFKVELIEDIPADQEIKIYQMDNWSDLCRGPHVPHTGHLGAFKLMSIAGAYWRANKDNAQLVRIYGTAFANKKDLDEYLHRLEEAKKRDHILLGKQLHLFTIFGDVAPGAAFLLPNGSKLFTLLQNYIRTKWFKFGFQEIQTPQLMSANLWKTSGHYEKFSDDMYMFKDGHDDEIGVKPMSCPGHVRLFISSPKSYRDLPLRYAEFGICHRNELSGTLHGLTRVRRFTQDDGHVFCTMAQVETEILSILQCIKEIYSELGFEDITYFLSTRPENKLGDDSLWDRAEGNLENALKSSNVNFQVNPGDGAFYGPKIDFKVKDAIGRMHQCATIQLDFQMPIRFKAEYQASTNTLETPVMIHRAALGSLERFMGIFIEHCAGHFPLGLSPVQCRILSVGASQNDDAAQLFEYFKNNGVRAELDISTEKLGAKIRDAQLLKIPYMLVIGEKETQTQTVTARYRDGKNLEPMSKEAFLEHIKKESGHFWGLDINQK